MKYFVAINDGHISKHIIVKNATDENDAITTAKQSFMYSMYGPAYRSVTRKKARDVLSKLIVEKLIKIDENEYGIALKERQCIDGLDIGDIEDLYNMLRCPDSAAFVKVYPIELEAREQECSAMGFITQDAANEFAYDYEASGLHDFIASILDDMNNENKTGEYEFKGVKIWLGR